MVKLRKPLVEAVEVGVKLTRISVALPAVTDTTPLRSSENGAVAVILVRKRVASPRFETRMACAFVVPSGVAPNATDETFTCMRGATIA